jgi:anti-anti-sigma factor
MDITVSQMEGRVPVTVFRVKGEINVSTHEQLQAQAEKAIEAGTRNLLLDLSEVSYISSAGVRALNHIFQRLRSEASGESDEAMRQGLRDGTFKSPHLKVLSPSPRVAEVLKIAGVDMFLEIHDDLQTAVASF